MSHEIINFKNVSYAYDNEIVLEDVNIRLYARQMVSIIGPNGSGKTTLLKLILGLLKPAQGDITVFDQPPEKVRHLLGYVPQYARFDPSFPVNVFDVVLMGGVKPHTFGIYNAKAKSDALKALDIINLGHLKKKSFAHLSGGQRQRVLIARALVSGPKVLLMDEPTANVDRETEEDLYALIQELSKEYTVVLVSHDLGVVPKISDQVVCVNRNVLIHSKSELTAESIQDMYSCSMDIVHHVRKREEHK